MGLQSSKSCISPCSIRSRLIFWTSCLCFFSAWRLCPFILVFFFGNRWDDGCGVLFLGGEHDVKGASSSLDAEVESDDRTRDDFLSFFAFVILTCSWVSSSSWRSEPDPVSLHLNHFLQLLSHRLLHWTRSPRWQPPLCQLHFLHVSSTLPRTPSPILQHHIKTQEDIRTRERPLLFASSWVRLLAKLLLASLADSFFTQFDSDRSRGFGPSNAVALKLRHTDPFATLLKIFGVLCIRSWCIFFIDFDISGPGWTKHCDHRSFVWCFCEVVRTFRTLGIPTVSFSLSLKSKTQLSAKWQNIDIIFWVNHRPIVSALWKPRRNLDCESLSAKNGPFREEKLANVCFFWKNQFFVRWFCLILASLFESAEGPWRFSCVFFLSPWRVSKSGPQKHCWTSLKLQHADFCWDARL